MSEETPPDLDFTGEWDAILAARTVKKRVYEIATALTPPTPSAEIAERADCTAADARRQLEWFVERAVLEKTVDGSGALRAQ